MEGKITKKKNQRDVKYYFKLSLAEIEFSVVF